jgi:hypothetical protein
VRPSGWDFSDSRVRDHTVNTMESTLRQTGCSNRSGRKAGAIALLYVLPANRHKKGADERTRTADLLITSELFQLDEQPAPHLFDFRPVYRTAIKVQVGTICVHVLSNTRK